MNKAYALLDLKSVEETATSIRIKGIASSPTTDRVGDIVMPQGARFKTPMPLFMHHDSREVVGNVVFAKPDAKGIPFEAELPIIKEAGTLKTRVDEAIHSLKYNLIGAVSIGFSPKAYEPIDTGLRIKEWEWLELSLVTIPANPQAVITGVKSFDARIVGALAQKKTPGASGSNPQPKRWKGNTMNSQEMRDAREQKAARLNELKAHWADNDPTDEESTEMDQLVADVKSLDRDIRLKTIEETVAKSTPVNQGRSPSIVVRQSDADEAFKGQNFTRGVIAKALAYKLHVPASVVAEARWGKSNPTLVRLIKANEVAGGGTGTGEWGHELVQADSRYTGDFIEWLNGLTAFGNLNTRSVPANVVIKGQASEASGFWVGESKAIPNTTVTFNSLSLAPLKVATIAVASNELLRDSSPAAEGLIRDALAEALAKRIDQTAFSTTAASAGVSPAGLLNGLTPIPATGTSDAELRADLNTLLATFDNTVTGDIVMVTTRALARQISLMWNSLGSAQSFPGVTPNGGNLAGYRVVVGDYVPAGDIIAAAEREIFSVGDAGIQVSMSQDAMIEQSSAPTGATDTPTAASQVFTSMFQEESTAIKVVRSMNFAKRRTAAVAYISGADYGTAS